MKLRRHQNTTQFFETLPVDGSNIGVALAPRWPLVPVLPTPVVDGARYCVGASYDVAVEYLGVGGVWVAQASKQYGVWVWKGVFRNAGLDWVNCARPTWINQLRPSIDNFGIRALFKPTAQSAYRSICALLDGANEQFAIGIRDDDQTFYTSGYSNPTGGIVSSGPNIVENLWNCIWAKTTTSKVSLTLNSVTANGSAPSNILSTGDIYITSRTDSISPYEGDVAWVEFWSLSSSGDPISLIDRYDFNLWDGTGSGKSMNGFDYVVSDGAPFTAKSYEWIPE